MFHLHPLPPPFFFTAHLIGIALLAITALVVARKFYRARCLTRELNRGFGMPAPKASCNRAFDEYRNATLNKLEAEADEFRQYLDRLRRAADAAAFDSFLKSRRIEGGPAT